MSQIRKEDEHALLENDEYRRLKQEHSGYERKLDSLADKAFLSDEEQRQIAEIKKKKLRLKDRMLELANEQRAS